jgi:two-component system LytT family response regulator
MKTNFDCQKGRKVVIEQKSKTQFVEMDKITHLKCNGYLTTLYTINSDVITVSKLLKKFEEELNEFGFVRANRSTLVNLNQVKIYVSGSIRTVELLNKVKIKISRRKVFLFKNN